MIVSDQELKECMLQRFVLLACIVNTREDIEGKKGIALVQCPMQTRLAPPRRCIGRGSINYPYCLDT
jgi:hypothetical protein